MNDLNDYTTWLDQVPDKFAEMLREGKIDYDQFMELTKDYRLKKKVVKVGKRKGFDLIG